VNCLTTSKGLQHCGFQAGLRNTGPGCARNVHTSITFLNDTTPLGTPYVASVTGGSLVRPDEVVLVRSVYIAPATIHATTGYKLEPTWTDLPCP
jgi:hypothetical protein